MLDRPERANIPSAVHEQFMSGKTKGRERFLDRYPVADTWASFIGRCALLIGIIGLVAAAYLMHHSA